VSLPTTAPSAVALTVAAQKSIMGLGNVVVAVIGVVGGNLPCLVKKVREGDDDWVDCRMFKVG